MKVTFRLRHHDGEVLDGSVDVTEPAAVELEENGGFGDDGGFITDSGGQRRNRGSWMETREVGQV